jgi:hypothetical protein
MRLTQIILLLLTLPAWLMALPEAHGQRVVFNKLYDFGNEWDQANCVLTVDSSYVLFDWQANLIGQDTTRFSGVHFIKTDKYGNIKVEKLLRINGYYIEPGWSNHSIQTRDSGFIMAGQLKDSNSNTYIYLVKFNSQGDTLWTRAYGGKGIYNRAMQVRQAADGGYFVGGYTEMYGADSVDVFCMKTDSIGRMQWIKTPTRPEVESAYTIDINPYDSSILICGYSIEPDDIYMYRLLMDKKGNIKWQTDAKGRKDHKGQLYGGFFTLDNHILVYGQRIDSVVLGYISTSSYVAMLDSNGKEIWEKEYGHAEKSDLRAGFETKDGDFVCAGVREQTDPVKPYILQGWIVKLDNKGNEIWERTPVYNPTAYDNYFYDIKPTLDKGFICGGVSRPLGTSRRDEDLWLVKLDSMGCEKVDCDKVGIAPQREKQNDLLIYPNPVNDLLHINTGSYERKSLYIYNSTGQLVFFNPNTMEQNLTADVSGLPPGLYIAFLTKQSGTVSRQFIKR